MMRKVLEKIGWLGVFTVPLSTALCVWLVCAGRTPDRWMCLLIPVAAYTAARSDRERHVRREAARKALAVAAAGGRIRPDEFGTIQRGIS